MLQYYTGEVFHVLSKETANVTVLDLGCSKIVFWGKWLTQYLELLEDDKKQVTEKE